MYIEEKFHWKEALCTGMSLIWGIGLIFNSFNYASAGIPDQAFTEGSIGVALVIVSIIAFIITDGWKHSNDLPTVKKILAYLPVVAIGLFFIALIVIVEIGKTVFGSSSK